MEKVKIVLDADVLIHFSKGESLSILPDIFPEYEYTILDIVYNEVTSLQHQLDNQINMIGNISLLKFEPKGDMFREYAKLKTTFGIGESACMAYCRYTNNVIGSSNLKDIKDYCTKQKITYLTTLDFLYYAYTKHLMTESDCTNFIKEVITKGSKLPDIDITKYNPSVML